MREWACVAWPGWIRTYKETVERRLSDSGQLEQAGRKALRASAPPARLRERGIAVPVVHGQDRLGLNIANTPLGFSSATHTCRS